MGYCVRKDDILHLPKYEFEGKSYILAKAMRDGFTVYRKDYIIEPVMIDRVMYVECALGDHVVINYKYNGVECTKRYKIIGKDNTDLFFICNSDPTDDEAIYLDLMDIYNKVQKGEMDTEKAHIQADELLVKLLYQKKLNLIADLYLAIPRWYS